MKRFVSLARVSSREQEREGFSLDIQVEALERYAEQHHGQIVRMFKIAETASKSDERKTFRELIAYAKKHCSELDGLLVYKVDRAARNLFDFVEIERLESEYDVPFICVTQPTESNPAGRMMRRTLANMASFYTEQQSVDVREGLARRVREGWFVCKAPYGYRNVRREGRGIVEIDPIPADNVRRIFHLYAYENLTLDGVVAAINGEGRAFRGSSPTFPRSSIHTILSDRAYIGELEFRGQWLPGKHEPLIDRSTWNRVQTLLGGANYHCHALTFSGELIRCGHCGRPITGERKIKRLKNGGERTHVYYRCARYSLPGHPRTRVPEADLDRQMLAVFDKMRIENDEVREWFRAVLSSQTRDAQAESIAQRQELVRQESLIVTQQDRLLNLRLDDQIDEHTFAKKGTELRDRLATIKLQMDALDRSRDEIGELASKVFELSQTLREKWLTADYSAKRRILEIVCLNFTLVDTTLVCEMRKPFDVIVEGLLVSSSRDDRI
ncbi:recombinase family protein [Caulifigura coniformis]|uniref:recombinase family protein n=1 Tax=Caulifigura coniformis TaxID=2527983 RepID=UPI0011A7D858|nr:recombinase family protein [Caulifigura coniformis]